MGKVVVKKGNKVAKIDEKAAYDAYKEIRKEEKQQIKKMRKMGGNRPPEDNKKKGKKVKKPKGKKKWTKKVVAILLVLVILLGSAGVYAYSTAMNTLEKVNTVDFTTDKDELGIDKEVQKKYRGNKDVINIALFGIDSRSDDMKGRSDSIMVATFNKKTGYIALTSILRDSYVKIDDDQYGFDKVNAAYAYGGPEMAVKVLNQNFDLNIENFITVDFASVSEIVDAIDGITVNVKANEVDDLNKYIRENNRILKGKGKRSKTVKAGKQKLDGKQALSYCRIRHSGNGDFDRAARQRIVLNKIYKKVKDSNDIGLLMSTLDAVLPSITTSLKPKEFFPLIWTYFKNKDGIKSNSMTNPKHVASGYSSIGAYIIIFEPLSENIKEMHKFTFGEEDYTLSENAESIANQLAEKTSGTTKYFVNSKTTVK